MWVIPVAILGLLAACNVGGADLPPPPSSGISLGGLHFSLREQQAGLCDAGTKQWTGTVDIGSGKSLFFWFFQSRKDPTVDPVVVFLQGGPAASSMMSLFSEVGPCSTNGATTRRVGMSWANHANLLFLDQPAGTGFSTVVEASKSPINLAAAALDFNRFLSVFYTSMFPSLVRQPLHIAGESFGGRYVPAYVRHISEHQTAKQVDSVEARIDSIILVSGYIDPSFSSLGHIDHFCTKTKTGNGFGSGFNDSACSAMRNAAPACERAGRVCMETKALSSCRQARNSCGRIEQFFGSGIRAGGNNPYDDRLKCTQPPACRPQSYSQLVQYCNLPTVQTALGFTSTMQFQGINFALNQRWTNAGDPLMSSRGDLEYILNSTEVRILVLNGNNDVSVNTPGNIRAIDSLSWLQKDIYRGEQFVPWFFKDGHESRQGGLTKGSERLVFVGVDDAGHDVPASQPAACLEVLEKWFSRRTLVTKPA